MGRRKTRVRVPAQRVAPAAPRSAADLLGDVVRELDGLETQRRAAVARRDALVLALLAEGRSLSSVATLAGVSRQALAKRQGAGAAG